MSRVVLQHPHPATPTPAPRMQAQKPPAAQPRAPATKAMAAPSQLPRAPTVPRLLDQCLPNFLSPRASTMGALHDVDQCRLVGALQPKSSPTARIVKRPNGSHAHLLELPPSVPYTIDVCPANAKIGSVFVLPVLTPAAAAHIRADAERAAARLGGWAPRAVGCCTNDVLVNTLGVKSQQLLFDCFNRVLMPFVSAHFPEANLTADSLPRSVEGFFVIKYSADNSRREFGEVHAHAQLVHRPLKPSSSHSL